MYKMAYLIMWEDFATLLELEIPATFLILRHVCVKSRTKLYYNFKKTATMDLLTSAKRKTKDEKAPDASLVNSAPTPSSDASCSSLEKCSNQPS